MNEAFSDIEFTTAAGSHLRRNLQNSDVYPTAEGFITLLVIICTLLCIVWAPWIVKRCREGRRRTNEDDSVMPEDFDGAEAELIQQSIRRTLEGGILFPTDTRRMSLEDRREYIANVLLSKHVMLAREKNNVQKEEEGPSKENGSHNLRLVGPISDINDDDKEDSSHDPCAICLNDYEDGDAICWSHNTHCSHVFHRQCISEWLLTHEECPCCRHAYLCFNDDEQDPTEESASTENSSVQPVHVPAVVMRDGYLSDDDNAALARGWQLFYNLTRRTTPPSTPQTVEHYATSFDRTRDKLEGVDTADDGPIGVEVANAASDETFAFDLPPASVPTETR